MRMLASWRAALAAIWIGAGLLAVAPAAQGAASDPLFVFTPTPTFAFLPPPVGFLEGPCGMGVDPSGRFYVSDYYHDVIDVYDQNADYNAKGVSGVTGYLGQLAGVDSVDGPCGLAFDASGRLYVNDYHRAVKRYGALGSFGAATTITGATTPEETHPTGVAVDPTTGNVYVDQRDHVSVFDSNAAPVMTGLPGSEVPLTIGQGSLQDGYGIAFSQYPGTAGYLYLPDAATNTVEVYDTVTPNAGPVEEIDGSETPNGRFVSLRDASIAIDRVTGEIYVVDDLQPNDTERPEAIVYVFHPDGSYEGHLKSLITWGMPSGLAVDNSETATHGRVYVTSGNSSLGSIYAYGPGAATTAAIALPAVSPPPAGESGALSPEPLGQDCGSCEKEAAALSAGVPSVGQEPGPVPLPGAAGTRPRPRHHKARHKHHKAHRAHTRGVRRAR
jgi:hypothetical protein